MEHWDIKQPFINAPLDEIIYVYPVPGFETFKGEVYKLKKALYGTKQAAKFLKEILRSLGGTPHFKDECVFIFRDEKTSGWVFLSTHVDDLFPLYNPSGKIIRDRIMACLSEK